MHFDLPPPHVCLMEMSIDRHMGTEGCHYNPNHGLNFPLYVSDRQGWEQ